MGADDKSSNKGQELKGSAKETWGKATGTVFLNCHHLGGRSRVPGREDGPVVVVQVEHRFR